MMNQFDSSLSQVNFIFRTFNATKNWIEFRRCQQFVVRRKWEAGGQPPPPPDFGRPEGAALLLAPPDFQTMRRAYRTIFIVCLPLPQLHYTHTVFPRIVSAETIVFLNLTLCTVTFVHSTYRCANYSRAETIRGNTVCIVEICGMHNQK